MCLLLTVILLAGAAAACPMCRDALSTATASTEGGVNPAGAALGFYYSIVLMVSTPVLLLAGITFVIVRERRLSHLAA